MSLRRLLYKRQSRLSLPEFLEADLSWLLLTSNTPQSFRLSHGSGHFIVWHLLCIRAAGVIRVSDIITGILPVPAMCPSCLFPLGLHFQSYESHPHSLSQADSHKELRKCLSGNPQIFGKGLLCLFFWAWLVCLVWFLIIIFPFVVFFFPPLLLIFKNLLNFPKFNLLSSQVYYMSHSSSNTTHTHSQACKRSACFPFCQQLNVFCHYSLNKKCIDFIELIHNVHLWPLQCLLSHSRGENTSLLLRAVYDDCSFPILWLTGNIFKLQNKKQTSQKRNWSRKPWCLNAKILQD